MLFDVLRSTRHFGEEHQGGDGILCHIMIRGCTVNVKGNVNRDHWVEIMSALILYFKVIVFPFPDSIKCDLSPPAHMEGMGSLAK